MRAPGRARRKPRTPAWPGLRIEPYRRNVWAQALRERGDALDVPQWVGGVAKFQFRNRKFVLNFCLAASGYWHVRCIA